MRILLLSKYFFPEVGGLVSIAGVCLAEFLRAGHEVRLATESLGLIQDEDQLQIFRRPSRRQLREHLQWCEVVFHNDAAARYVLPLVRSRKPYLVYMSGYVYSGSDGLPGRATLKRKLLTFAFAMLLAKAKRNLAACAAVGAANQVPARIVPNPFDAHEFGSWSQASPDHDFLFAGRIVSIKGVDDLIRALAILRDDYSLNPLITIAGPGIDGRGQPETPYGAEILELAIQLNVHSQLRFAGPQDKSSLRILFQNHRCFIIPSKWNEPIGIVALEAIASGCVIIGSNGGGLATTIGPCGVTFPNGNFRALAKCMADFLTGEMNLNHHRLQARGHLQNYLPEVVAAQYLEELKGCLGTSAGDSAH